MGGTRGGGGPAPPPPPPVVLRSKKTPKKICGLDWLAPKAAEKFLMDRKPRRKFGPIFYGKGGGGCVEGGWVGGVPPPPSGAELLNRSPGIGGQGVLLRSSALPSPGMGSGRRKRVEAWAWGRCGRQCTHLQDVAVHYGVHGPQLPQTFVHC